MHVEINRKASVSEGFNQCQIFLPDVLIHQG